jgi:hypothetical protein
MSICVIYLSEQVSSPVFYSRRPLPARKCAFFRKTGLKSAESWCHAL